MPRLPRLTRSRARASRRRWDLQQERYLPDREARFRVLTDWLAATVGDRPRCLDLGCGTGAVTERVLRALPHARVVAIDFDPVTRSLGEAALGSAGGRIRWIDADLRNPSWRRRIPAGRYDAALSSTALHWLTNAELGRLYQELRSLLRPGGIFLNADSLTFAPASTRLQRAAQTIKERQRAAVRARSGGESWEEWWSAVEREPALRGAWSLHRERFPHAHGATPSLDLSGHVRRLRAAGFREMELVYGRGTSRVLAALR